MAQNHYYFDDSQAFVIEQYNDCPPFASFLPGIAGVEGRPAWAFYVNRGQAIASFGVRNKDGAFLEFFPADKAYQLTASRGFRSFLKIHQDGGKFCYEAFQRGQPAEVIQRMRVSAHEIGVEESNPLLGLKIRADMFTLPQADVAGLLRRVEIANTSASVKRIEIVDGLPQVQPYAMNQWILKFMSRTSEAFMRVEGAADRRAFYRLKVWPTDSPQVEMVEAGNFFIGLQDGRLNPLIVDAEKVFGLAGDFSVAEAFFADTPLDLSRQILANQTPAAFQQLEMTLQPGESRVFYGVYGHAGSQAIFDDFIAQASADGYLQAKRAANRRLIDDIRRRAFTATAKPLFDAHVQQCYLDNGLRGGFPMPVPGGAMLYLFGRKHGDLERDYNDFLLQDTPYSEGNGDFRDVLQNRRVDLFFQPALADKNIRYFFNLIQPDGYNPCSLRNCRFVIDQPQPWSALATRVAGLPQLLNREFKYAELWQLLAGEGDAEVLIGKILATAREVEDAEFDRGYWSDHWSYLVDLLINYRAIFPEKMADVMMDSGYSFFDPTHSLAPRADKYRLTDHGVRQYGAVQFNPDKKALIESRNRDRYRVRDRHGLGEIVYTTLLGKIVTLVANKLATLDPAGVGIEMEADRPGWCDALNGLPGILGSAVNETIELKRLIDVSLAALTGLEAVLSLPSELAAFIEALDGLLQSRATPMVFWRESGKLKESYREQVFMGFAGEQRQLPLADVRAWLSRAGEHLNGAIAKAGNADGIVTYFAYQATDYRQSPDGKIEVEAFSQQALPAFLEGYVHALRIADRDQARQLYQAVTAGELFDRQLGMYRLNAPLGEKALELGRIGVFNYGWLENGSIFLHMHYKFVLEMLRAGLVDEFYAQMTDLLVAFHDPQRYKRNPLENSSFVVCSGFSVDPRQHGRGCVARLSGSTVELLHLAAHLFLGAQPFIIVDGELRFQPAPLLAAAMFTGQAQTVELSGSEQPLPADSAAFTIFGGTLLVYHNPQRRDSYGVDGVQPWRYCLTAGDGRQRLVEAAYLQGELADGLRRGNWQRLDVDLR